MVEWPTLWRFDCLLNCIILGFTVLIGYYCYNTLEQLRIFNKIGVRGPIPIPILGNLLQLRKQGLFKYDLELKQKYGPVVGCFMGRIPSLFIYDVCLLKRILIKDFHLFTNRAERKVLYHPLDKMLFFLKDDRWKQIRRILAATFSTGKMRKMSSHMNKCSDTFCINLEKMAESGVIFDFREYCSAFSMDMIASVAFGIEIDSHTDPRNIFVTKANEFLRFRLSLSLIMLILFPSLHKLLGYFGMSIVDKSLPEFFINFIRDAAKRRESANADFLQVIINAISESTENKNKSQTSKDEILLAQGMLFIVAGYEAVANTLSLFAYNMVLYPHLQEKLHQEITEKLKDTEPTHDALRDLVYLEMCLFETLRKYPPGPRIDRVAANDVTINGLFIPKGMTVVIPISAIQNDPEYWEEPEVFNPERFAPSVRSNIEPLTFMPFGGGPRQCVGMRLAILELKTAIVKMLRKFKFVACEETDVPLKFGQMSSRSINGIRIRVEERR